ncbi:hypothetical protein [Chromohalobacter israelensis]|uniref:hypothetical protein n=1 Tax=Chromohalobacter israelensis TaxID=141390 RepID=UPI00265C303C|nr:hypothetical protein [Chromohalobacter salexigens]MDO0946640.1 hypothetical protein [Chromohalobacter salexigens]
MAVNPDTSLPNRNRLILATSGGGKSQLARELLPAKGVRLLGWDIDGDHDGHHFESRAAYVNALARGVRSGKPFRLLWAGADDIKTFEWWCDVVFAALDGAKPTELLVEEMADVSPSSGKATPNFGRLARRARKYNGGLTMISQRGTEIAKTCYTQASEIWIGTQEGIDVPRMAKQAKLSETEMAAIRPLDWVRKRGPDIARFRMTFDGNKRKLTELTESR